MKIINLLMCLRARLFLMPSCKVFVSLRSLDRHVNMVQEYIQVKQYIWELKAVNSWWMYLF
ncbi:MAG: hypothetical protein D6778_09600 [Nitrospirae bacterium]|nr:MAG: hypothetical protein D6778_09600 [Nitrospirota bacterium]